MQGAMAGEVEKKRQLFVDRIDKYLVENLLLPTEIERVTRQEAGRGKTNGLSVLSVRLNFT